jgi:hypothetical protein
MHPYWSKSTQIQAPQGSFMDVRKQMKMLRENGDIERIFGDIPGSLGRY